jgi:hypothetical protein
MRVLNTSTGCKARETEHLQLISPSLRGMTRCSTDPAIASVTQRIEAATYAHPRKGCFPPIQETVEMTTDLVLWNDLTG